MNIPCLYSKSLGHYRKRPLSRGNQAIQLKLMPKAVALPVRLFMLSEHFILLQFVIVLLATMLITASAEAQDSQNPSIIEVFTNDQFEIQLITVPDADLKVYNLDDPARIDKQITDMMPQDPKSREAFLQSLGSSKLNINGKDFTDDYKNAYQGKVKAAEYRLTKLPAIVFNNGDSVVYGVTSVGKSLEFYQEAQNK